MGNGRRISQGSGRENEKLVMLQRNSPRELESERNDEWKGRLGNELLTYRPIPKRRLAYMQSGWVCGLF